MTEEKKDQKEEKKVEPQDIEKAKKKGSFFGDPVIEF